MMVSLMCATSASAKSSQNPNSLLPHTLKFVVTMVAVPHYVKAVALKNSTSHAVKVIATFGSDELEAQGKEKIQETRELSPGAEATIHEHEYDMGGWTATAALVSLAVEPLDGNGLLSKTLYTPSVNGIVNVLHVDIRADETAKSFQVAVVRET